MKRICILCLLAALLLGACGLADAPYMEPVRTYCAALQDDDFTRLQEAIPPAVLNADGFDAGELANVRDSFAKGSRRACALRLCFLQLNRFRFTALRSRYQCPPVW